MLGMISNFMTDKLNTEVYIDRKDLGQRASSVVAEKLKELLRAKQDVRMIFAAAPSQNEFLDALSSANGIDWSRVTGFHMDEYVGLKSDASQLFGNFLKERIFGRVNFKEVHYLNPNPSYVRQECERYSALLTEGPIDIVCMGIGENGHIAFNDPAVADFNDPKKVKVVELDQKSRQQQVNDGCFFAIEEVPTHAMTLTIPTLLSGHFLCVVVPGPTKAEAVYRTLRGEISTKCPASVLRRHDNAMMFLDRDSASKI